jgi:cytochrome c oxidase subunit 1
MEWATSCPPPRHNFHKLPRVRSDSPAFDLHHPEVALMELDHNGNLNRQGEAGDTSEMTGRREHLEGEVERGSVATKTHETDEDERKDGQ